MTQAPGTTEPRWRKDVPWALSVLVGCVLLGAPAGLLWSQVAPRLRVTFEAAGATAEDLESTKAFIGADGSYLLVVLGVGVLCGALAWLVARRAGPWTVGALVIGGLLGAFVAARVGVLPGSHEAVEALRQGRTGHQPIDLYLGRLEQKASVPHLRATWAALAWPAGALLAFLVGALARPEELD
ncbi:MAG TPA: hypothetical protein VM097_12385 [Mycobacteriales bacterium]|nr:hypothetical protein [Mycobacteriales bacterium]